MLRLELRVGVYPSGNPVYRNRSLDNGKSPASDHDLFDVAATLVALQEYALNGIYCVDATQLVQV